MSEPAERSAAGIPSLGTGGRLPRFPDGLLTTRIGELQFESGYPSVSSVEKLFDELDFQRACQAYLWSLPLVSMAQLQHALVGALGVGDCDLVRNVDHESKLGLLTANATAPNLLLMPNLARTGPLVIDVPPGSIAGVIHDFWQRPVAELGLAGRDAGNGARYLLVGPNVAAPAASGFVTLRSPTNNVMIGIEVLSQGADEGQRLLDAFQVYPHAERRSPPPRKTHDGGTRRWFGMPPRGLEYWERLHAILQQEPVEERDRFFTAMLRPLGVEKGKPFQPGDVETSILTDASLVGEAMARANGYDKRLDGVRVWSGRRWENRVSVEPMHRAEFFDQLDERAAWCYEAMGSSTARTTPKPGVEQVSLSVYKDRAGNWLEGGEHYRLVVPPYAPTKHFWSFTVYDNDTRALIDNPTRHADLSSRGGVCLATDGSAILHFGPSEPAGAAHNWIETLPGRGWFMYFRLYAPTERYFDRSWQLPDLERVR